MKNRKLKVALFGPYPPPYGGVSIHIQRLKNLLLKNNIRCKVYDITQFWGKNKKFDDFHIKKWPKILFFSRGIIHIQNSGLNLLKISILSNLLTIKGNKIIITYHSLRDDIENFNWFKKKVFRLCLTRISHFIVVNSRIKEKLINAGIKNEKITIIPGFLPPTIIKKDIADIPIKIWDFINNHHPVISANAFRIEFYNNQDLYGIDMCIELCTNIMKKYPKIGFVFCLPVIGDDEYFSKMINIIYSKKIENNFLFVTQPYQFYPILRASDLFVRPTNTDGDAISIRESLYFRIPSVVSDVVPRPKGTNLFRNRDSNDFALKVEKILENYNDYKKKQEDYEIENNLDKIMSIYKKFHEF
jgi:glycosyltransferase involved in cell wall biosynthesis